MPKGLQNSPITQLTINAWDASPSPELQRHSIHALEYGQLLFLPELSFVLQEHEQRFLSPEFVDPKTKNISYDASNQLLKGACGNDEDLLGIKAMVARFSQQACALIHELFPHYRKTLKPARTSFRPAQVSHRKMSYRKDDKRLHVDAFPSSPNQGQRILRVFSNINLQGEERVWRIGEPFETVAKRFLPAVSRPFPGSGRFLRAMKITKSLRTEYDHIMLQLHNRMKKDMDYQQQANQVEFRFPAQTTWIVQTDQVSHAAMSGQHLLEQTFYLPVEAMFEPQYSPLKVLERLTGRSLLDA